MDEVLSIVVPVYNVKKYVQHCIESLINQTYTNLEIILVDDGSTDGSGILCDELAEKDKRIQVIHKPNGGLSDARNTGIDIASGKYIGFVDSDDWVSPDMYEKMLESMIKENADIVVCGWIEEFRDISRKKCPYPKSLDKNQAMIELLNNITIADHAWDKLYRTHLFREIRYPIGKTYEDIRTTHRLFNLSEKIIFISEAFYHYRQRRGSIARGSFNLKKIEWLDAVESLREAPYVISNDIFRSIIEERIFHTKCFLLREMLLNTSDEYLKECMPYIDKFFSELKKRRLHVFQTKRYSKSIKVMAIATLGGKDLLIKLVHSHWYKKYIEDKYKYYD